MMVSLDEFVLLPDNASRREWLIKHLSTCGTVVEIPIVDGYANLLLLPAGQSKRLLVTHADRYPGSPGANDNSAACVQLVQAVIDAWDPKGCVAVAFTDLEETENCKALGLEAPAGAHAVARWLEDHGGLPDEIVVFDMTGCGDCMVFEGGSDELRKKLLAAGDFVERVSPLCLSGDNVALPGSMICCVMVANEVDSDFLASWATMHSDWDNTGDIWPATMEHSCKAMQALMHP